MFPYEMYPVSEEMHRWQELCVICEQVNKGGRESSLTLLDRQPNGKLTGKYDFKSTVATRVITQENL